MDYLPTPTFCTEHHKFDVSQPGLRTSQVALGVKSLLAKAGDIRDAGLIPELERAPGGHGIPASQYSSILGWRIPWTEEPGGRSPWGCRVGHD